jgi:Tol biopolymer transport system component
MVMNAATMTGYQLWMRDFASYDVKPIAGTESAVQPFFSPDGQWLAFHANGVMKKLSIGGGVPLDLCQAHGFGAAWLPDDTIVFNPDYREGLARVSAAGGAVTKLTEPDRARKELGHFWPGVLPDGKHILFTSFSAPIEQSRIEVYDLATGQRTVLVDGGVRAQYVQGGFLVYLRAESVVAVRFDPNTLKISGQPIPISEDVVTDASEGVAQISVAANGTMAYISSSLTKRPRSLVWVDRTGAIKEATPTRRLYSDPSLSPDEKTIAVTITEKSRDIWVGDLARDVFTRVTSAPAAEFGPIWTHAGNQLAFTSETPIFQVSTVLLSAPAEARAIVATDFDSVPGTVTADDSAVLYESSLSTGGDIMMARFDGKGAPVPVVNTRFDEGDPALSPDGRWLAYTSNESGKNEVYVQSFPSGGERVRVSTDGGNDPRWARDGHELFYIAASRMYAARVTTTPKFSVATPVMLFEEHIDRMILDAGYDVAKDGRFLMVQFDPAATHVPVSIVLNWTDELAKKLK